MLVVARGHVEHLQADGTSAKRVCQVPMKRHDLSHWQARAHISTGFETLAFEPASACLFSAGFEILGSPGSLLSTGFETLGVPACFLRTDDDDDDDGGGNDDDDHHHHHHDHDDDES